jgi:hypothetical protein
MGVQWSRDYRVGGKMMHGFDVDILLCDLWNLCRPNVLRSETEARETYERQREICDTFRVEFPEEVFERFGF